jgi:hypothetical protein
LLHQKLHAKQYRNHLKKLEGFFFPQHLFNWKVGRDGEIRSSEKKRVEESAKNNKERTI